jgi:serine/threonine protein kinase
LSLRGQGLCRGGVASAACVLTLFAGDTKGWPVGITVAAIARRTLEDKGSNPTLSQVLVPMSAGLDGTCFKCALLTGLQYLEFCMFRSTFIRADASFAEKRGRLSTLVNRNPNKTIYAMEVEGGFDVSVRPSGFRVLASKYTVERKDCKQSKAAALALLQEVELLPKVGNIKSKTRRNALVKLAVAFDEVATMVEPKKASIYGFMQSDRVIGQSNAGTDQQRPVVTATRMSDDVKVVIKILPDNQSAEAEITTLAALGKPANTNIVRYYGMSYAAGEYRVVMEHCPNGTLEGLEKKIDTAVEDRKLSRFEGDCMRLLLWRDTVRASEQMGAQEITHRDLRGANCFIDANWVVKVGDFGTADRRVRLNTEVKSDVIECKSPELLRATEDVRAGKIMRNKAFGLYRQKKPDAKGLSYNLDNLPNVPNVSVTPFSDMWSVGVIGYKLYFGGVGPFSNAGMGRGADLVEEIKGFNGSKLKFPNENIPPAQSDRGRRAQKKREELRGEIEGIVKKCLSKKALHRPTPQDLLKDPVWRWIGGKKGERALRSKMSMLFSATEDLPTHS